MSNHFWKRLNIRVFWWPRSLYQRLALWNILAFILSLVVLGSMVYTLVYYFMLAALDKRLEIQGDKLQTVTRIWLSTGHPVDEDLFEKLILEMQGDEFTPDQPYVKLIDVHSGRTIQRSPDLKHERLLPNRSDLADEFDRAAAGEQIALKTYQGSQGQEVRVLTLPIFDLERQVIVVAQLGRSLDSVHQVLFILLEVLLIGCCGAIILAYLLALVLTRRELRPLSKLGATMRSLSAQKLGAHLTTERATTEIATLIEAFNQMSQRLEASFTLQRNFVADVSHELRTPLTTIRGQIDVLLMHPDMRQVAIKQDVQQIRAELARLSRLVTNLLAMARADVGVLPQITQIGTQTIELDTLLIEIARQARFANQQVQIDLGRLEQCQVSGDVDLLKQLLFNIIDNALTYTAPEGNVLLEVVSAQQIPEGLQHKDAEKTGWACISICDTGSGITPEDLPHIFERYYRAASLSSRSKLGAGLGLALARLIAEAHGGNITVESELNKGSCFFVWLPYTL